IIASKTMAPAKFISTQARRLAIAGESFASNVEILSELGQQTAKPDATLLKTPGFAGAEGLRFLGPVARIIACQSDSDKSNRRLALAFRLMRGRWALGLSAYYDKIALGACEVTGSSSRASCRQTVKI